MATVNTKMTAIANEIRELSGTMDAMGLDAMASHVNAANSEITNQTGVIEEIITALSNKVVPSVGTSYPSFEEVAF